MWMLHLDTTWIPIWTLNKNAAPVFSCQNFCTMHTRNKQAKGEGRGGGQWTVEQLDKPTIEQASEKQERRRWRNRTQIHEIVDGFVLRDHSMWANNSYSSSSTPLCVESNSSGRPEHSRRRYFHCLVCVCEGERERERNV